jgi:formate hydrogenlyase subunit 3/multisubunit Na+/H+ antiporter MnhD subunit
MRAFFLSSDEFSKFDEASSLMVVPLLITAVLSLFLGIFPEYLPNFYQLAFQAAQSVFGGGGVP